MSDFIKGLAACFALWTATMSPAFSQALPFDWENEVPDANDDFTKCMNRDRSNSERTIRSCGRVIAERAGSEFTAAAYYSRGLMREMLQDRQLAREDFQNALNYFTIAIDSRDRHTDAYRNRAATLYRLDRYDDAIADYRAALEVVTSARSADGTRVRSGVADLRPNQISGLHYRIAGVNFRAGRWNEAIAAFDQAAALSMENPNYQAGRCEARAAAGSDLEIARAACELAIQLSDADDMDVANFSMAFLLFRQGSYAEALRGFSTAFDQNDSNYLALYARGVTLVRLGQADGAADIERATTQLDASAIAYYQQAGLGIQP